MGFFARVACAGFAAFATVTAGSGIAAAAPTVTSGPVIGSVTLGTDTPGENWTCGLVGFATPSGLVFNSASTGQTVSSFAPGTAVSAACLNPQVLSFQTAYGTAAGS
ncbi:hypothetical protein FOS14_12590 [Skermania sp. ID1734]|uniref:hypothetical protein n=1 Tax=Skermania sp. ID1734 TaxID=2597516 RepID=UPI00117D0C8D|nr:hypothetical protein [Skermania sp. ID1734]TSD99200.1 hypothetical protein FOS14_12590 [Skermania sp. ID1734]